MWGREGPACHTRSLPPQISVVEIIVKHRSSKGVCYAVFQLGRSSLSKNGYERFSISWSLHSSPSHEAASPADLA